ncbi:MAG TPA: tRNA uridine-5-carboxymethylaminomethyl(34) synthesis GTPase MnmE [Xanthobacteraceae bacterium]|nr:tRNA uridine-5-carboxymethylaminomethyl(34) synthesis GTPase MnmE [Xanthobacteraceae bacterium]
MSQPDRATIFALSSGRPPAAIAVVRISGPGARFALETMVGRVPEPRRATLARVRNPNSSEIIDEGLVLWFPGPRSETGEDMAEFQLHGGRAVISAVLAVLGSFKGFRMAEPGEFTRRAFENGRLDLTAVEGLADLIFADTEAQRRQAFHHLRGFLGHRAEDWRRRLVEALALVEARIDFSDEADVPEDLVGPALEKAQKVRDEIAETLADSRRGERLREGLVVAIAGPPNAGKSTLFNRLARREAAIVSPVPGTTRDVLEMHLDLEGAPVTVLDTAGIRASDDPIEQEGVERARARAETADLVLWVVDGSDLDEMKTESLHSFGRDRNIWLIINKIDKLTKFYELKNEQKLLFRKIIMLSARTGVGFSELLQLLNQEAQHYLGGKEPALITRQRHRLALEETLAALERAIAEGIHGREDIVAEELRMACQALGRLTGRVDVEDVLDVIFRDFCIGK